MFTFFKNYFSVMSHKKLKKRKRYFNAGAAFNRNVNIPLVKYYKPFASCVCLCAAYRLRGRTSLRIELNVGIFAACQTAWSTVTYNNTIVYRALTAAASFIITHSLVRIVASIYLLFCNTQHAIFLLGSQLYTTQCIWLAFIVSTLDAIDDDDATFKHNTPTYLDNCLSHTYCRVNSTPLHKIDCSIRNSARRTAKKK